MKEDVISFFTEEVNAAPFQGGLECEAIVKLRYHPAQLKRDPPAGASPDFTVIHKFRSVFDHE